MYTDAYYMDVVKAMIHTVSPEQAEALRYLLKKCEEGDKSQT